MQKMLKAYLYNENTVVVDKRQISGTKDEDFREISLIVPLSEIKEWNEEIEMMGLDDDCEELDEIMD